MRKKVSIGLFVLMSLTTGINATELKTRVEKESYSIGASTGSYISNQLFEQSHLGVQSDRSD